MAGNTRISINVKTAGERKAPKPARADEPAKTTDAPAPAIPADDKEPAKDEQPKRP